MVGALALTGCEEGPVLQTEFYETRNGESETYTGGACMPVSEGSGMGAGSAPAPGNEDPSGGYSYSYEGTGSGVRFVFLSGDGEVIEERTYTESFIASGKRDEVVVAVGDDEYRFVHWGEPKCSEIRDPDPQP